MDHRSSLLRGDRRRSLPAPHRVGVVALLVLGVLCVLVELQSPSLIYWTGERVSGTNDGGIAYYTVDGQPRTLDVRGEPPARPQPVTVYADPKDAAKDRLGGLAKWIDLAVVVAPFVGAGVVAVVGLTRPYRTRLRRGDGPRPSRSSRSRRWSR